MHGTAVGLPYVEHSSWRSGHMSVIEKHALWWRCHRRIIADYLIAAGESVFHIVGPGHIDPAHLTVAARPGAQTLTYPAPSAS